MTLEEQYKSLREGAEKLALLTAAEKNKALEAVALALENNRETIIAANKKTADMASLCRLSDARSRSISPENFTGARNAGALADPVNERLLRS